MIEILTDMMIEILTDMTADRVINELNDLSLINSVLILIKKNYMIFKPNESIDNFIINCNLSLTVKNITINRTVLTKYLGVWIDNMLSW